MSILSNLRTKNKDYHLLNSKSTKTQEIQSKRVPTKRKTLTKIDKLQRKPNRIYSKGNKTKQTEITFKPRPYHIALISSITVVSCDINQPAAGRIPTINGPSSVRWNV